MAFASAIFGAMTALIVAWHERRSLAHWAFVAGMAAFAVESILSGLAADAVLPEDIAFWQNWRFIAMAFLPGIWLFFSLTYARGHYREFTTNWRLPLAAAFLVPIAMVALAGGKLIASIGRTTTGDHWILKLGGQALILQLVFLIGAILILMNLERTFRAAIGTIRWRIKFMILGLGVLFVVRSYTSSQILLFRSSSLSLQALNSGALLVACLLILRSLFRAGHFEVSVYPSHSVLHNSLTVMLAGIYLLIIGVIAKIITFLGGDSSFALKSFVALLALALLAIVLLSDRTRLITKRLVSRHFQRPLYDYRTVWRTFTEGTARCVEQQELCAAVAKLASEIFQALSVSVWLPDDRKERLTLAASTSLSEVKARHLGLDAADAAQVIEALRQQPNPVDLDMCKELWAAPLRRLQPDEFRKGGNRLCVPMHAGGELLGLITIGDRVGGLRFSLQDLDLLKSVGDQAAASLLNIQLSQRVSQAKQLEAFQAMSAFFVHDLKNTASTLSLMLQNLPVHFGDPRFREDALRGISKTVAHINLLISRLSLFRKEVALRPIESDLNQLVTESLASLAEAPYVELSRQLRPIPRVRVDPAQIQNVVTNLVLNAREAVAPKGHVMVETSQQNGFAVVTVADDGCGMSSDFVEKSLFRPFQTTKKQGIGIGMFQCKTIVEAHYGRIEVDSQLGKGSAFRVLLPINAQDSSRPSASTNSCSNSE